MAHRKEKTAREKCHRRNRFDVHAMWLCRTVGRYYVAIPEAAEYLQESAFPAKFFA